MSLASCSIAATELAYLPARPIRHHLVTYTPNTVVFITCDIPTRWREGPNRPESLTISTDH